jgi:hypothetical protein
MKEFITSSFFIEGGLTALFVLVVLTLLTLLLVVESLAEWRELLLLMLLGLALWEGGMLLLVFVLFDVVLLLFVVLR